MTELRNLLGNVWDQKGRKRFGLLLLFGVVIYGNLIINNLANSYDGSWEGNFYYAGKWELSLGRWFWVVMSKVFTFGTLPEPVISMITLAFFSAGIVFFLDLLEVKNPYIKFLTAALIFCTPALSIQLSYRFMTYVFGVAFFFAVLAAWVVVRVKNVWISVPMGAALIAFSMGAYQPFLGCTCVCLLAWIIKRLMSDGEDFQWKKELTGIGKMLVTVLLGGILYILILKVMLRLGGVNMSGYMGGDSYSIGNSIKQLPTSFYAVYQIFIYALNGVLFYSNRLGEKRVYVVVIGVLFLIALLTVVCRIVKQGRKEVLRGIVAVIGMCLMPVAGLAIRFVATDANYSLQMATGLFLIFPALFAVLCSKAMEKEQFAVKCARIFGMLLFAVVLHGAFWQVQIDQESMREGRNSVESMVDLAIVQMETTGLLSSEYEYCFVGTGAASPLYCTELPLDHTNTYAVYGRWWGEYNSQKVWRAVVREVKGINLRMSEQAVYTAVTGSDVVKAMPVFPQEGSIQRFDNVVVVKFSEY